MTLSLLAAPSASSSARTPAQQRAAREFEAVFAGQLAQHLLSQVEVDPAFGGGHGEELFRGVLAEELGRAIAATGSLGLAPAVQAELQRMEGQGR